MEGYWEPTAEYRGKRLSSGYNKMIHHVTTLHQDPSNGDPTRPRPFSVVGNRKSYFFDPLMCATH